MDENLARGLTGYQQLQNQQGRQRTGRGTPLNTSQEPRMDAPVDSCNCIYISLLLAGTGFLLPYNSFVIAVDYYQERFPLSTIIFDMSLTYILVAFVSVLIMNILVETLSLQVRITFGYVLAFFTLLVVTLCDIWFNLFPDDVAYSLTLLAIAVVAFGSTAQQSSFYGYTSMLPPRYTQAVMTGESAAGLVISINRMVTKAILTDKKINTMIFFCLSMGILVVCFVVFHLSRKSQFVLYYIKQCQSTQIVDDRRPITTGGTCPEEVDIVENGGRGRYGVLAIHSPTSSNQGSPDQRIIANQPPTGIVDDSAIKFRGRGVTSYTGIWQAIKNGMYLRYMAAKTVWPYMVSIGVAYFVTLCLFPGIESEVWSCRLHSWMPVILMAIFNLCDFIGKIIASIRYDWPTCNLVLLTCCRLVLVPLMMICATPRLSPILAGEGWSMAISALLGITNGYFGSVPMILAPAKVPEEQKELTGNIMMLSYSVGLTTGSAVAYLLDDWLGPQLTLNPCQALNITQSQNLTLITF